MPCIRPHSLAAALALAAVSGAWSPAAGQMTEDAPRTRVLVAAGLAVPLGDFGDIASTGFIALAGLSHERPGLPIIGRAEVLYQSLGGNEAAVVPGRPGFTVSDRITTIGAVASGLVTLRDTERGQFYVIGGLGLYRQNIKGTGLPGTSGTTGTADESSTRAGFNIGGGLEGPIGPVNWYVEARLHRMFSGDPMSSVLPITAGIRF